MRRVRHPRGPAPPGKLLRSSLLFQNRLSKLVSQKKFFSPRVAGLNASDLAETTVEKKRVAKTKKRAENIEESLELVEKGKGINGRMDDRDETIIPKRKQEKAKEKNRIGNSSMDGVVERVGQLAIDQTELTSARRKKIPKSILRRGKPSEAVETAEDDDDGVEDAEDVEDSIVSGFVVTGRSRSDVTRKPRLNTVVEQDWDFESAISTSARKAPNSYNGENVFSCDNCETTYDDAKDLRRHMKAKHR